MYNTSIVKNYNAKKMNGQYSAVPVVSKNHNCNTPMKKSDVVALFMGDYSTSSGSCVQSRLLGPSDTYSVTSSQQSCLFHPLSDGSSFTSSSYSQWVPPPYTAVDNKTHYVNVPVHNQSAVQVKTIQRTSRRSVWLGLIFGFSIFLLLVLGAVIAYGLEKGML